MEILKEFPAYKLIKPVRSYYADGDIIALPHETRSHGTLYSFFTFGSVAGYAIKNGECPEEGMARCRKNMIEDRSGGHKLWWVNQNSIVLHNGPVIKVTRPLHEWGDTVRFHGRDFTLEHDHNGNCKLVEVEKVEAA